MASVDINWLTVILASIVAFIVGAVWYSPPLFGKYFSEIVGRRPTPASLALSFAMTVAAAAMLGILVSWAHATGFRNGALVGIVGWVVFQGSAAVANLGFEPDRSKLTVANAAFQLVQSVILGAALGHWQ